MARLATAMMMRAATTMARLGWLRRLGAGLVLAAGAGDGGHPGGPLARRGRRAVSVMVMMVVSRSAVLRLLISHNTLNSLIVLSNDQAVNLSSSNLLCADKGEN